MSYSRVIKIVGIVLLIIFSYFGIGGVYAVWHRKVWDAENTCPDTAPALCLQAVREVSTPVGLLVATWPVLTPFTFARWVFSTAGGK